MAHQGRNNQGAFKRVCLGSILPSATLAVNSVGIKGVILAATLAASAAFAAGLLPLLVAMTASPGGAALAVDPASLIREASALNSSGNA